MLSLKMPPVVDVKGYGLDKYGRVLGVVSLDGKNINLEMVKTGLAEVYRGKMRQDFDLMPYHAAEREARNLQKGIWSTGTIYVSPKVWREKKRKNEGCGLSEFLERSNRVKKGLNSVGFVGNSVGNENFAKRKELTNVA